MLSPLTKALDRLVVRIQQSPDVVQFLLWPLAFVISLVQPFLVVAQFIVEWLKGSPTYEMPLFSREQLLEKSMQIEKRLDTLADENPHAVDLLDEFRNDLQTLDGLLSETQVDKEKLQAACDDLEKVYQQGKGLIIFEILAHIKHIQFWCHHGNDDEINDVEIENGGSKSSD